MGQTSAIEWTNATWNPWMGCTKVSPGCARCYMFREQRQYGNDPEVVRKSKTKFRDPLKWTEPRLIFTCSWSDWFHETADAWRDEAWEIIRQTPQHTYQILTKRSGRMHRHLPWAAFDDPWPNVWLGVSIETQNQSFRARQLRAVPATVRFISAEPLLGPLALDLTGIHWLIAGGESGPGWRPMEMDWVRSLRAQCREQGTAFFMKQDSGPRSGMRGRVPDDLWLKEMPNAAR